MADEKSKGVCAHHGCTCATQTDSKYCSAFCETAAHEGGTTIGCGCGHNGCGGELA